VGNLPPDTLGTDRDGKIAVRSRDRFDSVNTYTFGDVNSTLKFCTELHNLDPKKEYQGDAMIAFASSLHKKLPNLSYVEILDGNNPIAAGCMNLDGNIIDSMGVWTQDEYIRFWGEHSSDPHPSLEVYDNAEFADASSLDYIDVTPFIELFQRELPGELY
jgi:hypothetical protein